MLENEPLAQADARLLVRDILENGEVEFTAHAIERMAERGLSQVDVVNVLRGGWVEPPEFENDRWRYRVTTQRICVVVQFESKDHVTVVTAIRFS